MFYYAEIYYVLLTKTIDIGRDDVYNDRSVFAAF